MKTWRLKAVTEKFSLINRFWKIPKIRQKTPVMQLFFSVKMENENFGESIGAFRFYKIYRVAIL